MQSLAPTGSTCGPQRLRLWVVMGRLGHHDLPLDVSQDLQFRTSSNENCPVLLYPPSHSLQGYRGLGGWKAT